MKLGEYLHVLAYDSAFWLAGVYDPDYPLAQLGNLTLEVSEKLRAAAIIVLLVKADADAFYHNLVRSARTRQRYLQRLADAGIAEDHHRASGRFHPLLDAVAADAFTIARAIASLSPSDWQPGHEYEDDYCYAQVLHRMIQDSVPESEIDAFLGRLELWLDGRSSARLDVCRALLDRDQATFETAFEALLDGHAAEVEAAKARGQLEEPHLVAQRQVSLEGLAVLRLAGRRGLATHDDYRFCPSLARVPMTRPFPDE